MNKLQEVYYKTVNGVKNLITWLPIIWADRDWDYMYLLFILDKKLETMSKHHKKGHLVDSKETQQTLDELRETISRILDGDYEAEAFSGQEELLEKQKITFTEQDNGDYLVGFEGLDEKETEQYRKCLRKEDDLLQEDIEKLFDTIKENIQRWWD